MEGGSLCVDTALLTKINLALNSTASNSEKINPCLRGAISEAPCFALDSNSTNSQEESSLVTDDSASETSVGVEDPGLSGVDDDEPDRPFFVCDLGEVRRQHDVWTAQLPRIEPWYAVKCNPARAIVDTLSELGSGFDCASREEIELALAAGADPGSIIFANPCKLPAHLRYARARGVTLLTFDNEDELVKIRNIHPTARCVLRLLVDDSKSICRFGVKFGAAPASAPALLAAARGLGLDVVGVSFHVGSGCKDVSAFRDAVCRAREAFDAGAAAGYSFDLLDCGGGFPGADNTEYTGGISFCDIAAELGAAVDEFFPDRRVRVIAEPGRYFAASSMTLVTQVHSKRMVAGAAAEADTAPELAAAAVAPQAMYYLNDGVYGSFNCIIFDHYVVSPRVLTRKGAVYGVDEADGAALLTSSLWGPTCDSMDCVMNSVALPELEVGDWLCFKNMGAYTIAAASNFNGLYSTQTIYIDTTRAHGRPRCFSVHR